MNVAMIFALLAFAVSANSLVAEARSVKGAAMKDTWPWYHSADEIHSSLSQLAGNCHGADLDVSQRSEINAANAAGEVVQLDVVHISRSSPQPKAKAMLIFGEHAREVISPESALHFVRALCGEGPEAERASRVLDNVSFTIVPNANPMSRKLVEQGYYCKRTNEDGVDLNRNFGDAHRVASGDQPGEEMNPGPSGFSEPESRILKGLIDEERPEIYISVHSGAYLLGTPFGYTADQTPDNEDSMLEVLRPISDKYCEGQCPYGNLAKLINYDNPGCDIDYVKESAGTPYVFTWEIYVGESFRDRYIAQAQMQRSQQGGKGGSQPQSDEDILDHPFGLSLVSTEKTKLRGRSGKSAGKLRKKSKFMGPEAAEQVESCMDQFNPQSEEETRSVVQRWTNAYLELCEEVTAKEAKKSSKKTQAASLSLTAASEDTALGLASPADDGPAAADADASSWPALGDLSSPPGA